MQTDWVLIARLARELDERLRGARVDDAGLLSDGRVAILLRQRSTRTLLAADLFSSPPMLTLEAGELGAGVEPPFVRTLARSLRGMILAEVSSRRDDRLLRLGFTSRSRFGVGDRFELFFELVPRFGNAVLVKEQMVVAAYREFSPAENASRSVQAGSIYELPPLPANPRTLAEPPSESALEFFAGLRARHLEAVGSERTAARRRALEKRLRERERRLRAELASLDDRRRTVEQRDALRLEGEGIFATLYELDEAGRAVAKEHAAKLFARYKKLAKTLPHLDAREREIRLTLEAVETLRWEGERAADEDLDGVEAAVNAFGAKKRAPAELPKPRRKRALLEYRTPGGSRIVVGRSPLENAEVTFRLARPNDLWFHAQRIPGAHVILARDDRSEAPDEDLQLAASLAALHSRGKASASVPVDYTLRKHVRKQRAAPPGLVWYTHAKTIVVEPRGTEPAP
ncbi:MAG TPA: NFACT RNA binding domain-containing protein [Candidatus Cybelea sp.]|nr:NFACT RNA binding domain-containing protein [Candidatus Cybelea sp.]